MVKPTDNNFALSMKLVDDNLALSIEMLIDNNLALLLKVISEEKKQLGQTLGCQYQLLIIIS